MEADDGEEVGEERRVGTTPRSKLALYERTEARLQIRYDRGPGSDSIDDAAIASDYMDARVQTKSRTTIKPYDETPSTTPPLRQLLITANSACNVTA